MRDATIGSAFVEAIEVTFMPNESLVISVADVVHFDWTSFDEHTTKLSSLRVVIFGFPSRQDMQVFADEVEPRLQHLRQANKMRYGVWKHEGARSRWTVSDSGESRGKREWTLFDHYTPADGIAHLVQSSMR